MTSYDSQTSQTTPDWNKSFQTKSQFFLEKLSLKLVGDVILPSFFS